MIVETQLNSREAWLEARKQSIGGSEAAAVIGLNPWMDNVKLWKLKRGDIKPDDLSDNPAIIYGTEAEKYLRSLFALDYPEMRVGYVENNLFKNPDYPFAHASLDGWLEENGKKGVLEIKTATIKSSAQLAKWKGKRIPENYYCQILHEMAVYEADFAVLKAQLKWESDDEVFCETKHYRIERSDVEEDIRYLMHAEEEFWDAVIAGIQPNLILPEI